MKRHTENAIYLVVCLMLITGFHAASNSKYNLEGALFGQNFNLISYVLIIGGTFGTFAILFLAYRAFLAKGSLEGGRHARRKAENLLLLLAIAAGLFFFYRIYLNENDLVPKNYAMSYLRHKVPVAAYFVVLAICFIPAAAVAYRRVGTGRAARVMAVASFACFNAVGTYAPNPFLDAGGGMPHIHAYVNSIVNASYLIPFDKYNCSVYGHYGLLYLPAIKILGHGYLGIAAAVSMVSLVTYLCVFYVMDLMVKNDVVFMFGVFGVTGLSTMLYYGGQYFQVNPHRLFFPFLMLAVLANNLFRHHAGWGKGWALAEVVIGAGSIIWNMETGLFSLAVCMAYHVIVPYVRSEKLNIIVKEAVTSAISAFASILLGYFALSFYNIAVGGDFLSWDTFIYPFGEMSFDINSLRLLLPNIYHVYLAQIVISLMALCSVFFCRYGGEGQDFYVMRGCIAVSALSSITYFMNRTAYGNIGASYIQLVMSLALFADRGIAYLRMGQPKSGIMAGIKERVVFCGLCGFALFSLGFEGGLYVDKSVEALADSSWDTSTFLALKEGVEQNVPAHTFAYGTGIPELYYEMGWDTQCHIVDWSGLDMNLLNFRKVSELQEGQDRVFANVREFQNDGGWLLEKEFACGDYNFGYYVRQAL